MQLLVDMPMDSVHASGGHALLIARRGVLVVEEYFHGFHRDEPHDLRSAAKSLTSVLVGAAMRSGAPLSASTPVYRAARASSRALEPRRRALTVAHLLTMSPGFECDDADPDSAGNEDRMQAPRAIGARLLRRRKRRPDGHGHPGAGLVVALLGGTCGDRERTCLAQRTFVPRHVLPAVVDAR